MIKSAAPVWLTPFLVQERLPFVSVSWQIDKHDNSLMPVQEYHLEGVPFRDLARVSCHSNPSSLSQQLGIDRNDPFKLVTVERMNSWLLRSNVELAWRYRKMFGKYLKDLSKGNFHLVGRINEGVSKATG